MPKIKPDLFPLRISSRPLQSEAKQGIPLFMASIRIFGKPSYKEGKTKNFESENCF